MRLIALKSARAVGIRVRIDGDDLELEAAAPPPSDVLDLILRHKADILRLLRPSLEGWSPRTGGPSSTSALQSHEFDGGLPRPEAEARAFACCVTEWLNRNAIQSPPGPVLELRRWRTPWRSVALLRDRHKRRSCLAASGLLACMASDARGRGNRGACFNGYSSMRTWR